MTTFADLADRITDELDHDWLATARPEQIRPPGEQWVIWLYLAGRGAGKTRSAAEDTRMVAESGKVSHICLIGPTAADVRDVMIEGPSGLLSIAPNHNRPTWEPSKRRVIWPNGVQATAYSSEEPENSAGRITVIFGETRSQLGVISK